MATEPTYTVKKLIAITPQMADSIAAYRFAAKIGAESEAIRRLIQAGLAALSSPAAEPEAPKAPVRRRAARKG